MAVSKRRLAEYLIAVAIVLLATLARWMLDPILGDRGPLLIYFFAISLASWIGGGGPGILALFLGAIAADYFFISPRGSLGIYQVETQIGFAIYLIAGSIQCKLAESQRRARASAEQSARQSLERQFQLEAEIVRREQVEQERGTLLAEQGWLRTVAEEQSATLNALLDQAPFAIVLYDAELRHIKANGQAARMIGLTADRVIGWTIRDLMEGITPESKIAELEGYYRNTIATGEPFSAKAWSFSINLNDPSTRYLDWSIRRVDRPEGGMFGLLGTFVDVTDEVEQARALRKSEELFRLAADAVDGLIYDVDMTTGRVERTRGMYQLLGYHPDEAPPTAEWWFEQVHPDDLPRLLDNRDRLDEGTERTVTEYRVRHRDGHYIHVIDRSIADIRHGLKVERYVGCTQDVTEIRQAEEALREADRRKDEFLAVLAHEIRNPLASIRNSLRLMKPGQSSEPGPVDIERDRAMAERQVAHLARLIDDLMDVSRISRGLIELRREPIELANVLRTAIDAAKSPLEERGHHLTVALPDRPIPLQADPTRLEQVFGNLLNNAIKYTSPGGEIRVSAEVVGAEVAVKVTDSGLGIDAEMLPKVFGMFVQDGKHLGHSQGGLGIGLGLSRSLIDLHGGRIWASSDGPGQGSEFEVRLPLADRISTVEDHPSTNGQMAPATQPLRKRILVIDDNEDIAVSLCRLLSRIYGHEVRIAHDGPSALELADTFHPEIVLLDIGLPEMDGCEVARRLRERPEFADTLLVALTGWGQEADRKRSQDAGIDHHLVKPVDPDALADLIAGEVKV